MCHPKFGFYASSIVYGVLFFYLPVLLLLTLFNIQASLLVVEMTMPYLIIYKSNQVIPLNFMAAGRTFSRPF